MLSSGLRSLAFSVRIHLQKRLGSSCCGTTAAAPDVKQITAKELPFLQHLVVLGPTPAAQWPSDLMKTDPYLSSLTAATSILANLKISASHSSKWDPVSSPSETERDILVFPEMLRFRKVGLDKQSFDLVVRYLVESRLGVFDKVPLNEKELKVEKLQEDGVLLVCAHDQVDTRCGERGTRLMEGLAEAAKDSSKKYSILPTSHIGGHDFAANLISYPRGDFYGNLAQTPSFSAKHVLSAIESNTVLWDHWRGRVGLDANTTKRMALAKKDADQLEKSGCGSKTVEGKGLGTGETIKVTYVLANGQRIEVDAELTEFNPADPEQPYFPSENDKAPAGGSLPPKRDNEVDFYFQLGSETRPIRAKVGENLMHIARDHKIPTIDAVCGGEMECATCHVIVGKEHFAKLPKATEGEEDMLEYAIGRKDCSRLSCQLKVTKEMEGMEVKVHMPPGSEIFI